MEIVKAPLIPTWDLSRDTKVFLAGSIEMGAAEDWQKVIPLSLIHI